MIRIPRKAKVRINGIPYIQVKATIHNIKEGDLVLDTIDNCYGTVDMKLVGRLSIRHGCVIEVCVPINRVRKLIPTVTQNQNN